MRAAPGRRSAAYLAVHRTRAGTRIPVLVRTLGLAVALALAAAAPARAPARALGWGAGAAAAQESAWADRHPTMSGATLVEKRGGQIPLDVPLVDHRGRTTTLGAWFDGVRPVLIVPGYYQCDMLCGVVLDGVAGALASSASRPGSDFRIVAISIDPRDTPGTARTRRDTTVAGALGEAWPFLVGVEGDGTPVARLMDAIGFRYALDARSGQYAHPAVVVAATPDGRVSGYLTGVSPSGAALDDLVRSAAAGETGHSLTGALMRCFRYTPALRRWAGLVAGVLRGGGLLIVLATGSLIVWAWRRARANGRAAGRSPAAGEAG